MFGVGSTVTSDRCPFLGGGRSLGNEGGVSKGDSTSLSWTLDECDGDRLVESDCRAGERRRRSTGGCLGTRRDSVRLAGLAMVGFDEIGGECIAEVGGWSDHWGYDWAVLLWTA